MKRFSFLLLVIITGSCVLFGAGDDLLKGIPLQKNPLEIRIGFSIVNITDVNEREETIDFDGALYLAWKDARLAHDPAGVGYPSDYVLGDHSQAPRLIYQGDFAVKEVFYGWRPHLVITNGIGDRNMGIDQWNFEDIVQEERTIMLKMRGGEVYPKSEFIATIFLHRLPMHFLISIVMPLLILVVLSWTVFWLDEEGTSNRLCPVHPYPGSSVFCLQLRSSFNFRPSYSAG